MLSGKKRFDVFLAVTVPHLAYVPRFHQLVSKFLEGWHMEHPGRFQKGLHVAALVVPAVTEHS